jgi:drug/metabolite transporter (DMT)-like permease
MGLVEWALVISLSLLWGGSFLFGRVAVRELHPLTVVLARVGIAAIILLLAMAVTGRAMPKGSHVWRSFLTMGMVNNVVPFGLIFWGQTQIGAGLAAILNATTPVFAILVARVAHGERLSANRIVGILFGVLGVIVIVGPEAHFVAGGGVAAQSAVLGAAVSYAIAGAYGRRFRDLPPIAAAAGQLSGSTLIAVPVVALVVRPWNAGAPSPEVMLAILGLATASTALGYVVYFRVLSSAGPTNVLLVTLLIPVSAALLGFVVLGERLDVRDAVGMVAIALGLAAIDGRPARWIGRMASRALRRLGSHRNPVPDQYPRQ